MTFKEIQKNYQKLLKEKEKILINNYSDCYKDIEKELKKLYEKCEKNGRITLEEVKKYSRLEKLDDTIAKIIIAMYELNDLLIEKTLQEIVKTTRDASIEAIGKDFSIRNISKTFDVDKVVNAEVAGRTWKERTKHYTYNFTYDMHSVIKQGLEQGDTYTTMCRNLKEKIGKSIKKPMQIVRTESQRVLEFTKMETMKEVNKKVPLIKIWHTVGDERVRSSHQKMEGVTVDFDEMFVLPSGATALHPKESGDPDEDINCRCWAEYKVKEE